MSAEVQKVLITTFSLVLYPVKYLKKEILRVILALLYMIVFIHWSRY